MTQSLSPAGRRFIERWEELVLYVYDDKVPLRLINGKRQYVEWDWGPVRGTLTIGYGHTDAAGPPDIYEGMHITAAQADAILDADLAPCMADVRRAVKVPLTQGQFDALTSFDFNCGAGNLAKLVVKLNQGDYDDVPRRMLLYVNSKGERMQGLVNRRNGEIALWNAPEAAVMPPRRLPPAAADDADADNFSPKGERVPPPKAMASSKTGSAAVTIGAGGVIASVQAANDAAGQVKEARDNLHDLGLLDWLMAALHHPAFWAGIVIVVLAAFVWFDRRSKLRNEHV